MSTIAILILVVIVLIAVAIFFFMGFAEGGEGLTESQILTQCQSKCQRAQLISRGIDFGTDESGTIILPANCNSICGNTAFCKEKTDGSSTNWDYNCEDYVGKCEVTGKDGVRVHISCLSDKCVCTRV